MTELESIGIDKEMSLSPLRKKNTIPENDRESIVKQMAIDRVNDIIDKTERECDPTAEW
jgi:hypothetical protein